MPLTYTWNIFSSGVAVTEFQVTYGPLHTLTCSIFSHLDKVLLKLRPFVLLLPIPIVLSSLGGLLSNF